MASKFFNSDELKLLRIVDLKQILIDLHLPTTGNKSALIKRILDQNCFLLTSSIEIEKRRLELEITQLENEISSLASFNKHSSAITSTPNKDMLSPKQKIAKAISKTSKPETRPYTKVQSMHGFTKIECILKAIADKIQPDPMPIIQPTLFSGGDLTKYNDWKKSFLNFVNRKQNMPASDKLHYLKCYTTEEAQEVVLGYCELDSELAFTDALTALDDRYGNCFMISQAFRKKLRAWPQVAARDSHGLRKLTDFLKQCKTAMANIKHMSILNDCEQNQQILTLLPDHIVIRWNDIVTQHMARYPDDYPSFSMFVDFMVNETKKAMNPISSLEAVRSTGIKQKPNHRPSVSNATASANPLVKKIMSCVVCKLTDHKFVTQCPQFRGSDYDTKIKVIKDHRLCFRCLNSGHNVERCSKNWTCSTCGSATHHMLVHKPAKQISSLDNSNRIHQNTPVHDSTCSNTNTYSDTQPFSMTVPVWVSTTEDPCSEFLTYALLDTQSNTTFITNDLAENLNAHSSRAILKLSTMTQQNKVISCQRYTNLCVRGFDSKLSIKLPATYSRDYIPCCVSSIPNSENLKCLPHLAEVAQFVAPELDCGVGLLIGCDCVEALAPLEFVTSSGRQAYAVRTSLGWAIVGPSKNCNSDDLLLDKIGVSHRTLSIPLSDEAEFKSKYTTAPFEKLTLSSKTTVKEITPHELMREIDMDFHPMASSYISQDDLKFLEILDKGTFQDENGFYNMPLPFKTNKDKLANNYHAVLRRFEHLQTRFKRDAQYRDEYSNIVQSIIDRGEAEKVPIAELDKENCWYLPHHGVRHKRKLKLRVVFDCSAQYRGLSLNDVLLQGPDLNNPLLGVLLRFRQAPIAITCDIENMFHRFRVSPENRDYLRFIWFEGNELVVYRMCVHIFGSKSSPNCAKYALKRLADEHATNLPLVHNFIHHNFYVDDGLCSVQSVDEGISLIRNTISVCKKGNVRVHKLLSSNVNVLKAFPISEVAIELDSVLIRNVTERTLGIMWSLNSDSFKFTFESHTKLCSRRNILSSIASVFDPLGLLSPLCLSGRMLLQETCKSGHDWDEALDNNMSDKWNLWKNQMCLVSELEIPRYIKPLDFRTLAHEIHTFSDASLQGYGACSYLRSIDANNTVHCSLLLGKSRVSPLKPTTIPRLELQAALLGAKQSLTLQTELEISPSTCYLWTDSKIVLGYLNNDEKRFHTFVANRLSQIHEISNRQQWHYVNSKGNPADLASRGVNDANSLVDSVWFRGPDFLWKSNIPDIETTNIDHYSISSKDPELRKDSITLNTHGKLGGHNSFIIEIVERLSNWTKATHVLALIKGLISSRFKGKNLANLSVDTIQNASLDIVRAVQSQYFAQDISRLKTRKTLDKTSKLYQLDCFLDIAGILRVGGRVKRASHLLESERHPIVLPGKHSHVTNLIIEHYHKLCGHQGRTTTMSAIRSAGFWIVGLSSSVSSHIHFCITCKRLRSLPLSQKMADLPEDRLQPSPPFTYIGCDCFGPFFVKDYRKEVKRYGVLFTCLSSRAVHIEILDDMSSDAFINSLRCLVALRGNIRLIRCDNGTNFVGADNELRKSFQQLVCQPEIREFLLKNQCDFLFNPPYASHMGGAWERMIRITRSVFSGLTSHISRLDTSSLRTLLYECMTIINSRPLSVVEHDTTPLSPNDLLHMKSSVVLPIPGNFEEVDLYSRKRWKRVQFIADCFWNRWKKEYISNLQRRQKWTKPTRNLSVDDVVLLVEGTCVRTMWRLGRVVEVTEDQDGLVRKAKVKAYDTSTQKTTIIERPISKLIYLL